MKSALRLVHLVAKVIPYDRFFSHAWGTLVLCPCWWCISDSSSSWQWWCCASKANWKLLLRSTVGNTTPFIKYRAVLSTSTGFFNGIAFVEALRMFVCCGENKQPVEQLTTVFMVAAGCFLRLGTSCFKIVRSKSVFVWRHKVLFAHA